MISEDITILKYVIEEGRKWSRIAPLLPKKKTEHMIKNRFNTLMVILKKYAKNNKLIFNTEEERVSFLLKILQKKSKLDLASIGASR